MLDGDLQIPEQKDPLANDMVSLVGELLNSINFWLTEAITIQMAEKALEKGILTASKQSGQGQEPSTEEVSLRQSQHQGEVTPDTVTYSRVQGGTPPNASQSRI